MDPPIEIKRGHRIEFAIQSIELDSDDEKEESK